MFGLAVDSTVINEFMRLVGAAIGVDAFPGRYVVYTQLSNGKFVKTSSADEATARLSFPGENTNFSVLVGPNGAVLDTAGTGFMYKSEPAAWRRWVAPAVSAVAVAAAGVGAVISVRKRHAG